MYAGGDHNDSCLASIPRQHQRQYDIQLGLLGLEFVSTKNPCILEAAGVNRQQELRRRESVRCADGQPQLIQDIKDCLLLVGSYSYW